MTHSNGENVACANYSRGPKPNVSVANPIGLGRGFRRIGGACVLNAKNGSLIGRAICRSGNVMVSLVAINFNYRVVSHLCKSV